MLLLYHRVYRFCIYVYISAAKLCCIKTRIKNCNILYSEHLFYDLNMCNYVFLLHQKSFDMTLVNNPLFYDGGVTLTFITS
jgi:hypothetical protein